MTRRQVQVRRVYDAPQPGDGTRVLVDRLWPRGLAKDALQLDEWLKDVAPSKELRQWYDHDPDKFGQFRERYRRELASGEPHDLLERLRHLASQARVTLLTATKDVEHSQAAVLAELVADPDAPGSP